MARGKKTFNILIGGNLLCIHTYIIIYNINVREYAYNSCVVAATASNGRYARDIIKNNFFHNNNNSK